MSNTEGGDLGQVGVGGPASRTRCVLCGCTATDWIDSGAWWSRQTRRMTDDYVTCRARLAQVSLNSPCVSFLLPFSSAGVGRETGPGGVAAQLPCSTALLLVLYYSLYLPPKSPFYHNPSTTGISFIFFTFCHYQALHLSIIGRFLSLLRAIAVLVLEK